MVLMDPIADALIGIKNSDSVSKYSCTYRPAAKLLGEILGVLKGNGYIKDYEYADDGRDGTFKIFLSGKINDCKAIKPRYAVKKSGFDKFEKRYLPAKNVGLLIVSTPTGVVTHIEAKKNGTGGRLLAFVY
jgi:small subunit ribosomal protein S8